MNAYNTAIAKDLDILRRCVKMEESDRECVSKGQDGSQMAGKGSGKKKKLMHHKIK